MSERLIIDGNAVYEIDEDCKRQQEARKSGDGRTEERAGRVADVPGEREGGERVEGMGPLRLFGQRPVF